MLNKKVLKCSALNVITLAQGFTLSLQLHKTEHIVRMMELHCQLVSYCCIYFWFLPLFLHYQDGKAGKTFKGWDGTVRF